MDKTEITARERSAAIPTALLTLLAVALFVLSLVLLGTKFGADGNAELLRKIDKDSGTLVLIYVIRAAGSALLVIPLAYLFRAAQARSDTMRGQLIGLIVAGPLFMALFSVFTGLSLHDAAPDFVAKHVGGSTAHMDDVAQSSIDDSAWRNLAAGFGIAGALGFAVAMAYTALHAMRVGLLTRLWGSLGVALGVGSIVFPQYALLWFVYLGLLIGAWLPLRRPPAWETGEAVPWPTPGERMAAQMSGEDADEEEKEEQASSPTVGDGNPANPPGQPGERRKRKRRSGG